MSEKKLTKSSTKWVWFHNYTPYLLEQDAPVQIWIIWVLHLNFAVQILFLAFIFCQFTTHIQNIHQTKKNFSWKIENIFFFKKSELEENETLEGHQSDCNKIFG